MSSKRALILVDLQNDFVAPGALPVPGGADVVPVANRLMKEFELVVATQDWHPADHQSFASQHPGLKIGSTFDLAGLSQIVWPDHCVQGSLGADFLAELQQQQIDYVVRKGTNPQIDSYSGFFDNGHRHKTDLHGFLQQQGVTQLYVMGLATDYCVKYTILDGLQLGYHCSLILDGCRGVDLHPGDVDRAVEQMRKSGAMLISSKTLL
jgi:nicotinamidase/pyrazinamidase